MSKGIEWTRIEARVGTGVPDINGVTRFGEFWIELKVCDTKKFKTSGLWRPHQVSWQSKRASFFRNVWNVISHPAGECVYIYSCDKILDLNEPDKQVEPDLILKHPFDWQAMMDHITNCLTQTQNSTAMDYECATSK